jgi:hypothetical protein
VLFKPLDAEDLGGDRLLDLGRPIQQRAAAAAPAEILQWHLFDRDERLSNAASMPRSGRLRHLPNNLGLLPRRQEVGEDSAIHGATLTL